MNEQVPTDGTDGRSSIVRHALELLDDIHPEDLSIREVARRAGLSSGAPYHHFGNKTALLAACAVVAWTDLCEQLEPDDDDTPERQLAGQASSYLRFARSNPGSYRLITIRLLDGEDRFDEILALRARAVGHVIGVILTAADPSIDQPTAKVRGLAMWSLLHGHLTLDEGNSTTSHVDADRTIARLATRMALLPVEAV